jgi:type IV pilus assembly protein PilW
MKGLSLVELMIAMTLGLATVAAVGWVYLGTMQTYRTHDAISRVQEGARHAFELIGKDLRMTGAVGCPYATYANDMTNSTAWYTNLFGQPLIGIEQDATDVGEVNELSDALSVLRADVSREFIVQNHNSGTATFTLPSGHGIQDGELLVATDCTHAAVFQATATTANTVGHTTGGTPGNSTGALGATYTPGSRVYRLNAVTYYVAVNGAGVPSLYRLVPTGTSATLTPEELVEGVEDLQVTFGVDTDIPADGIVDLVGGDGYISADDVDSVSVPGANTSEKWSRVVSVRVSLLIRTAEDRVASVSQQYSYNGVADIDAPDLRIRKVFTHVIKVRNR